MAGWGDTDSSATDSKFPDRMREAQVPIVSDSSAQQTYDALFGPSGYIPPIQVAAGTKGKDTCGGDSGGPLFAKPGNVYRQIGIQH